MDNWAALMSKLNEQVLSTFGREVTYSPQVGGSVAVTLKAIFEAPHQSEENSPGTYALLFIRLSDLPQAPDRGDEVQVGGSVYKVFEIEADGQGGATLAKKADRPQ